MTSEGLGEMFEGDSADMCAGKFPLMLMGGRAEGHVCADPGARTPIGVSENSDYSPLGEIAVFSFKEKVGFIYESHKASNMVMVIVPLFKYTTLLTNIL